MGRLVSCQVPEQTDGGCVFCILGRVQRNLASDYVVQNQLALGFRRRPVCSKPGWRIGCADWVRNTSSSVVPFKRRGRFGDVQIVDVPGYLRMMPTWRTDCEKSCAFTSV